MNEFSMSIHFPLLKKLIKKTGTYNLRIISDSMYPVIYKNRVVIIKPKEGYAIGDVIAYYNDDEDFLTCHRIIQKRKFGDSYVYITKGDNCTFHDKRIIWNTNILGKVTTIKYRKRKEKLKSLLWNDINRIKTRMFHCFYNIKYATICFIIDRGERI